MTSILSAGKISNKPDLQQPEENGFTLIEMIAVLILLGVLLAWVTPFLMSTLDRMQSDSSARKLASMLASARSRAVAAKTALMFQGDLDHNQYWVTDPRTEDSSEVTELDRTIRFRGFEDGEESMRDGIFSVTFFPLGTTSGGTILLEPSDADADAPAFALTIDPVTGKSYLRHAS